MYTIPKMRIHIATAIAMAVMAKTVNPVNKIIICLCLDKI